jgi:hypothetical protein
MKRFVIFALLCIPGVAAAATSQHTVVRESLNWMARDANPKHPWLYVATFVGGFNDNTPTDNAVSIYDMAKAGMPRIGKLTLGLVGPTGIALDGAGTLYVPNFFGGNLLVYPPGATQPSLTLTQSLNNPASVAVDASGDVYVLNRGGSVSDIVVYPPGQTSPSEIIKNSLIQTPGQCLFDRNGNLYVSDRSTGVYTFAPGSQQPVSLNLQGLSGPSGLALDRGGDLFVGNLNGNTQQSAVAVYPAGSVSPAYTLPNTPFSDFLGVADLGVNEYVMVSASQGVTVTFFQDGALRAPFTLTAPTRNVYGVVLKPAGLP